MKKIRKIIIIALIMLIFGIVVISADNPPAEYKDWNKYYQDNGTARNTIIGQGRYTL